MIVPIVALNISREKIPRESKLKVCKTNKKHKKNSKQANSFPKFFPFIFFVQNNHSIILRIKKHLFFNKI